jgi:hypothetical protein
MRFLATTLLFIRLLSAPSHAQSQVSQGLYALPAVISGIIADPMATTSPGASVSIAGKRDEFKSSTVADANGRFTFENPDPRNEYQLAITASGLGNGIRRR